MEIERIADPEGPPLSTLGPLGREDLDKLLDWGCGLVIGMDSQLRIAYLNRRALEFFGYQGKEILGEPLSKLFAADACVALGRLAANIVAGGCVAEDPLYIKGLRKNGAEVCLAVNLCDLSNGSVKLALCCRDVTEVRRQGDELRRLWRAIEQSASTVLITDANGIIQYINPSFSRLTGYSEEEVVGKNPRIIQSGQTPKERYRELWGAISSGGMWQGNIQNRRKNGELFWSCLSISAVKDGDGKITHYVAVENDVTAAKHFEEELTRANTELQRSNADLKQFTAMVSHDLRSPLATVATALEILTSQNPAAWNKDAPRLMDAMSRKVEGMGRLVKDLLAYSRVGAAAMKLRQCDLSKIVGRAIDNLGQRIHESGAEVSLSKLPVIRCDDTSMLQVFQNLIENGVKFNRSGQPRISIAASETDTHVEVSVSDNGVGIPKEEISGLFVPFKRSIASGDFEGSGLGLATCKKAVEIHGGAIWVESEPGKGSVFRFRLPKQGPAEPAL